VKCLGESAYEADGRRCFGSGRPTGHHGLDPLEGRYPLVNDVSMRKSKPRTKRPKDLHRKPGGPPTPVGVRIVPVDWGRRELWKRLPTVR
jgi:hypothetical protein